MSASARPPEGQTVPSPLLSLRRLTLLAIALTLLALVFIELTAEAGTGIFWHLLATDDLPAAWVMLAILLGGPWLGSRCPGGSNCVERFLLTLDRQRHALAIGLWAVLCAGTVYVYHNHPLSMDEYAALFQAKVFAAGAMHGQFPPDLLDQLIPPSFQNHFLMVNRNTGAVFAAYWPGFAILLTPFEWLGIPWACNPTLVAASVLLIGRVARDLLASPLAAGWAMLFALASPAFVANGITYYAMPAHLLLNLCFAWLLLAPSSLRLLMAGLVGGFSLVLHNPFPHAVFALPWIFWLATKGERRIRNIAWLGTGYLLVVLPLGLGWSLWHQETLREGIAGSVVAPEVASPVAVGLSQRGIALLHSFVRVLHWPDEAIVYARLGGLAKLWLWASPLLLLLAWIGGRGERTVGIRLLGASALLTFFAYFAIVFDQGHGWGYRYFHAAWGALPILAALGAVKLSASDERSPVAQQLLLLTLLNLAIGNGLRLAQMEEFVAGHLAQFPPRVEADHRTIVHNGRGYYARDLIQNDPWLRGRELIFLASPGPKGEALKHHLAGKRQAGSNPYGATYVERLNSTP